MDKLKELETEIETLIKEWKIKEKTEEEEKAEQRFRIKIEEDKADVKDSITKQIHPWFLCTLADTLMRTKSTSSSLRKAFTSKIFYEEDLLNFWSEEDKEEVREHFRKHAESLTFSELPYNFFQNHVIRKSERLEIVTGANTKNIDVDKCYFLSKKEEENVLSILRKIACYAFELTLDREKMIDVRALSEILKLNDLPYIKPIEVRDLLSHRIALISFFQIDSLLYKFGKDQLKEAESIVKKWILSSPTAKVRLPELAEKKFAKRFNGFRQFYYLLEKDEIKGYIQMFEEQFTERLQEIKETSLGKELSQIVAELNGLKSWIEALKEIKKEN